MHALSTFQPNLDARFRLRLAVIGHTPHWDGPDGVTIASEPYVREMRIWADLFSQILVCSPRGAWPIRKTVAPFDRANIRWIPLKYPLSPGKISSLKRLVHLPGVALAAIRTIRSCDFVLLRSPGHVGLVGAALVRVMRRPSITKWANINRAFDGERLAGRLDRWLQAVPNRRHPVLVYGPAQISHHISFIPAFMSDEEVEFARKISSGKTWTQPWRILCVGRLSSEKNFELVLHALKLLKGQHPEIAWIFTLVGDGDELAKLEQTIDRCGLRAQVTMTGALPFKEVQNHYAMSHLLVQPNPHEGWGKVIPEAWAHGAIPVAADGWITPHLIREENAGVIFEPTSAALADALAGLLTQPQRMQTMTKDIHKYCRELSLTQFKIRLERVLVERCGLK